MFTSDENALMKEMEDVLSPVESIISLLQDSSRCLTPKAIKDYPDAIEEFL